MRNRYLKVLMLVIFMTLGGSLLTAQSGPPDPPDGTNDQNNKLGAVPIDSSVIWFIAIGSLYGIYRTKEKFKLNSTIK